MTSPIASERLSLQVLQADILRLLLEGEHGAAERRLGARLPAGFVERRGSFLRRHLSLHERYPERAAWCARLILETITGSAVGTAGFHGPPEAVGRAEIGYEVFEPYRRRGFATEAARALVEWGLAQGEDEVYAAVSPHNLPSLAIIRGLGFREVGVQEDPEDGTELVFRLDRDSLPPVR